MVTCKHQQMSHFDVWQPRYRDKTVLLAKRKVANHNKISFSRAPSLGTEPYYVSGTAIKRCKVESNGSIDCYVVSLDKLEPLEYTAGFCEHMN